MKLNDVENALDKNNKFRGLRQIKLDNTIYEVTNHKFSNRAGRELANRNVIVLYNRKSFKQETVTYIMFKGSEVIKGYDYNIKDKDYDIIVSSS